MTRSSFAARLSPRLASMLASVALVSSSVVAAESVAVAAAPAPKLTAHMAAAKKAEKARDFPTAAAEYRAALVETPSSADAALGVAKNEEAQGHLVVALSAYEDLSKSTAIHLSKAQATLVSSHIANLRVSTGLLSITVTPDGADVTVDEASVGQSPIAQPIRVMPGSRVVAVKKANFDPQEKTVKVSGGTDRTVKIDLVADIKTGKVTVRDAGDKPLHLKVDGSEVGVLPWSGDLAIGEHVFLAYDDLWADTSRNAQITKGGSSEVVLSGAARTGGVDLSIDDHNGFVLLDGAPIGDGSYTARIAIGPHRVGFTREGYKRVETDIDVKEGSTVHVAAKLYPVPPPPEPQHDVGIVSHLELAGAVQLNKPGSESEINCAGLGTGCKTQAVGGTGIFFGFGHMWKYIGFDLDFGFTGDTGRRTYTKPDQSTQSYYFDRLGAIQSARFRAAIQNDNFRGVFAIGPGISERWAMLGFGPKSAPSSVSDYATYASLGLNVDLNGEWRFTKSTALSLGLKLWIDNAGDGITTPKGPQPGSFHIVSGTQTMLYPYLGLTFGP